MFSHFSRAIQTNTPGVVDDARRRQQRRRPGQSCYDTCTEQWKKFINVVLNKGESNQRTDSFLHDCTWEHGILEGFLGNNAHQTIQQRGHSWAQIPEETRLPHQAILFTALAQATPRSLEGTWNTAVVLFNARQPCSTYKALESEVLF